MVTWDDAEPLNFVLSRDDATGLQWISIDQEPPRVIVVDGEFLDQADPGHVRRRLDRNTIRFDAANIQVEYAIIEYDGDRYLCERVQT